MENKTSTTTKINKSAINLSLFMTRSSSDIHISLHGKIDEIKDFGISPETLRKLSAAFEVVARRIL